MQVWNVLHAARWKCRTQKIAEKSPSAHHRRTLSGYVFATEARIDNRKKNLLSSNISSRCVHNMVNFGLLAAEIDPVVWGTPSNFNGFHVLAALLHGSQVVSVSQTFAALKRGRHLCSAGRPSGWALAHILVPFRLLLHYCLSVFISNELAVLYRRCELLPILLNIPMRYGHSLCWQDYRDSYATTETIDLHVFCRRIVFLSRWHYSRQLCCRLRFT